jgi:hypothetical protein
MNGELLLHVSAIFRQQQYKLKDIHSGITQLCELQMVNFHCVFYHLQLAKLCPLCICICLLVYIDAP